MGNNLITIVVDDNSKEYGLAVATNGKGEAVEFTVPVAKNTAITDVPLFCERMAEAFNLLTVWRFDELAIVPLEDKGAYTKEDKALLTKYKNIKAEFEQGLEKRALYLLLARIWFNFNLKGCKLNNKAQDVVDLLRSKDTFTKNDCSTVNNYLNDLMKPYISSDEYDEVKNFTAKLKPEQLKRLGAVANTESFVGTKKNGVKVKRVRDVEVWRQFMLYTLAEVYSLWAVDKKPKAKSAELIG